MQMNNLMKSGKEHKNKMRSSIKMEKTFFKKPTQTEILVMKNTITDLKNSIESFQSRLDQAEERICDLKDKSFEIIPQSKEKKKERMKKE